MTAAESKWVHFQGLPRKPGLKTDRWVAVGMKSGQRLGGVGWHSPWRRYVFWPLEGTLYDAECLHDIATFCLSQTKQHKATRI